jgi:hypothetical protein
MRNIAIRCITVLCLLFGRAISADRAQQSTPPDAQRRAGELCVNVSTVSSNWFIFYMQYRNFRITDCIKQLIIFSN